MLSIIIATKGRGEQAAKLIHRLDETLPNVVYEIICIAHPDDSNRQFLVDLPSECQVHYLDCRTTAAYNEGAKRAQFEWLLGLDDDVWPEDDWWSKILKCLEDNNNPEIFMIKLQLDKDHPHNTFPHAERAICSRKFCQEILGGVFEIPSYIAQRSDMEKSEKAMAAGCFFVSEAIFEHRHWLSGKAKVDKTYEEGGIKYQYDDLHTYISRHADGFPIDYEGYL